MKITGKKRPRSRQILESWDDEQAPPGRFDGGSGPPAAKAHKLEEWEMQRNACPLGGNKTVWRSNSWEDEKNPNPTPPTRKFQIPKPRPLTDHKDDERPPTPAECRSKQAEREGRNKVRDEQRKATELERRQARNARRREQRGQRKKWADVAAQKREGGMSRGGE